MARHKPAALQRNITVQMPAAMVDALFAAGHEHGLNASIIVRQLIKSWLEQQARPKDVPHGQG